MQAVAQEIIKLAMDYMEGDEKAVYGSKSGDHPFEKMPKIKHSSAIKESIFCGQCHGLGPNLELDEPFYLTPK